MEGTHRAAWACRSHAFYDAVRSRLGDYSKERHEIFAALTIEQLLESIERPEHRRFKRDAASIGAPFRRFRDVV
jgi:hypothetical protein